MHQRTHRFRKALIGTAAIGLIAAPVALAAPMDGGDRNPSGNASQEYTQETQIIGEIAQNQGGHATGTGGFVTRQSNKSSSGGGAIYGCRATAGTEACVAANNLANGDAFRFQAAEAAASIGQLRFGIDINKTVAKPPFVTNGTGLVKNLNADALDGKSADAFVEKGSLLFARVAADGAIAANRGVPAGNTAKVTTEGAHAVITVPFEANLSQCVATANPTEVSGSTGSPLVVAIGDPANTVKVTQQDAAGAPYAFALQVTC
jgi:hypothetical protein